MGGKRKTHKEFLEEVFNQVKDEYTILEKYNGANNKILIRHNCNKCDNYTWTIKPSSFLHGQRCPMCNKLNKTKGDDDFKQEVYNSVGDEYTVLGEYKNSHTKISLRHNVCNHVFEMSPDAFLRGQRCPNCNNPKKTHLQFKTELYDKYGKEYEMLEEYKGSRTKIKMKHNVCNNIWMCIPTDLLNGHSICPVCALNKRKKSNEDFIKEVYDLTNNEYVPLEEYKGATTKIKMQHIKCKYIWDISPDSFLRGTRCPRCARDNMSELRKMTNKEFIEKVNSICKDKYIFLTEYAGADAPITIKCLIDDYIWTPKAGAFLRNNCKCPKCSNSVKTKNTDFFKNEILQMYDKNEYKLLTEYKGAKEKIILRHICGYEWSTTPSDFLNGNQCPNCHGGIKRKTTKDFKNQVYKLVGNEYDILEDFQTGKMEIRFKHNICNEEFYMKPENFISGSRCPICNESKGERIIRQMLKNNNIDYIQEFTFKDCKDKYPLPFDFALFNDKEKIFLKCIVEYDGIHHFQPVNFGGQSKDKAIKNHEKTKYHDLLKDKYCSEHNIKLIRIPYWDFDNIKKILAKELNLNNEDNNELRPCI